MLLLLYVVSQNGFALVRLEINVVFGIKILKIGLTIHQQCSKPFLNSVNNALILKYFFFKSCISEALQLWI